jgi:uncharacterized protein (TIGR02284 family)
MLKGDREVPLNELLVACRKAADHYDHAAELVDEQPLIEMFRRMSDRRNADASRVESLMRKCGYFPGELDSDALDLSKLVTATRSAVSSNTGRPLIEKAVNLELKLEETLNSSLQNKWTANVPALLRELRTTSQRHRDEMIEKL